MVKTGRQLRGKAQHVAVHITCKVHGDGQTQAENVGSQICAVSDTT